MSIDYLVCEEIDSRMRLTQFDVPSCHARQDEAVGYLNLPRIGSRTGAFSDQSNFLEHFTPHLGILAARSQFDICSLFWTL